MKRPTRSRLGAATVLALSLLAACRGKEQTAKPSADDPWASKAPGSAATATPTAEPAAPAEPALTRPFFYTAKKDTQTVYLLGTMHLGVNVEALPPSVMQPFAASKQLVVEADINDPTLLGVVLRKDGKTLRDDLGAEAFAKFEAVVGKQQAAGANMLRPAMAATLVQMQGLPQTGFMDMKLIQAARTAGAEVIFLESAASQLALLEKWITAKTLIAMLDHVETMKQSNQELLALYRAGDDVGLLALSKDTKQAALMGVTPAEQDAMMKDLLLTRNAAWIPGIEAAAAKGPTFVAVGALHLLGPGSVVELLQAKGWTVERSQ
ncbi:MAG: TraB/GumN family protein [Myxococcales bacterium]|nr:TraB/GumN family protein [Myxococcales bacterium]